MIYRLSDICTITKGDIGIMNAIHGEYTMITLGEENKSHNEYQFDAKAVIIPLVSSTGHGHASMKRVKYFEGKFVLGNILCAVITKDEKKVNAKYLHIFLHENREKLLVSLMKGAANVSLPIKRLDNVEVVIPSMRRQLEIVELEKTISIKNDQLIDKFENQIQLLSQLRQSILQKAIQGKLTAEWREQNPNIEPATELHKRIKTKREQLIKENKREKPISPISKDEIPFELPQGWVWCRLEEICEIIMGQSPDGNSVNSLGNGIEFHQGKIFFTEKIIAKSNQTTQQITKIASKDSVLLCVRAPVGKVNISDRNICIGRGLCALKANQFMEFLFLFYAISTLEKTFVSKAKGSIFTAISLDIVRNEIIPLPPIPEQQAIVNIIETLLEKCNKLQEEIENMNKNSKELLKALFNETFGETNR